MATERPKRKAIPDRIKLEVVLRQDGRCPHCGERLGPLTGLNFDHRPAIINRDVNEDGTDYVPPQLDPEFIQAVHEVPCHRERTIGRGGEKRTTVAGSDIHIRDKTKRLVEKRLAREATASNLIEPISELSAVAKKPKSGNSLNKRKIQSASRWPPKKPKVPYRRRGV
jgi:5-methylcytosine-specific restriction endonuclease McrA